MKIKSKFVKTTLALCVGFGLNTAAQAVPTLVVGDVAFKINGVNFFSAPDNGAFGGTAGNGMSDLPGVGGVRDTVPLHPAQPAGTDGDTWGIGKVTSIHKIATGNIENPGALSAPIWTETATDHLSYRFGGLTMTRLNPAAPGGFPYDIFFGLDVASAKDFGGGTMGAYLEFYNSATDDFVTDAGLSAGTGAYGTFGTTIDNGVNWLNIMLTPGILSQKDPSAIGFPLDIEKTVVNGLTTGSVVMYGDVMPATGTGLDTNLLPLFPIAPTGKMADIKIQSTLDTFFDPTTGAWTDPNWGTLSNDPITGRVPEPGTMLLLGAGMLGLGAMRRGKKA